MISSRNVVDPKNEIKRSFGLFTAFFKLGTSYITS